jgi:hypothetical protein
VVFQLRTTEVNNNNYRYVQETPVKRLFAENLVDLLKTKCSDSSVSKKIHIMDQERLPLVYALGKPAAEGKTHWGKLVQKKLPYSIESASMNLVLRLVCSRCKLIFFYIIKKDHRPYLYIDDNDSPLKFIVISKFSMASQDLFFTLTGLSLTVRFFYFLFDKLNRLYFYIWFSSNILRNCI